MPGNSNVRTAKSSRPLLSRTQRNLSNFLQIINNDEMIPVLMPTANLKAEFVPCRNGMYNEKAN